MYYRKWFCSCLYIGPVANKQAANGRATGLLENKTDDRSEAFSETISYTDERTMQRSKSSRRRRRDCDPGGSVTEQPSTTAILRHDIESRASHCHGNAFTLKAATDAQRIYSVSHEIPPDVFWHFFSNG